MASFIQEKFEMLPTGWAARTADHAIQLDVLSPMRQSASRRKRGGGEAEFRRSDCERVASPPLVSRAQPNPTPSLSDYAERRPEPHAHRSLD